MLTHNKTPISNIDAMNVTRLLDVVRILPDISVFILMNDHMRVTNLDAASVSFSDQLLKCIFAHILVNVPMFVNILNAAKVLVIAAHLLVIVESIQADVHINVDMMAATRALHVKQY